MEKKIVNLELRYFEYDNNKISNGKKISNYEIQITQLNEKLNHNIEEKSTIKENQSKVIEDIKTKMMEEVKIINDKYTNVSLSLETQTKIIKLNKQIIEDLNQKIIDLTQ